MFHGHSQLGEIMRKEKVVICTDLTLVSALVTMGIPFAEKPFDKVITEKGVHYTFFLNSVSNCGEYSTKELIQYWNDDNFVVENDEHPFAFIKLAFKNRDQLLDLVKQSKSTYVYERNGKTALIGEDLDEETKIQILKRL